ncbi:MULTISPECIES: (2Fe-2S)-binding protein [Streptomyces]|uniref:(2Fe-2S)-binding protein n=1 Tax=Streptomyces yangpuensis TaxID=1648182 RepID=A0ABY5Q559_9ACTN|nr:MULTISPECIES: (2Fe-2S)-binding protein [Streptomyces]MBZ9599890.1 (2Fe-2S)-binding protein [Streptomyces erythrochromogenes]UUY51449.1 (2Fe-2S)-binding protein [Streptomyces yangpuensis]
MDDVLLRLAAVGPFFAVPYGPEPPGPGFRPLTALYGEQLGPYVAEVGRRIGSGPGRVAASTAQFGIASRLWSVGLGCAALDGRVPDLAADRVWWRLPEEGSLQLWLPEPGARPVDGLGESVLGNLAVLEAGLRQRYGVSPTVLRGNAASGLVGALRVLIDRVPGGAAVETVRALLAEGGALAGTGTFLHEEGLGVAFVRRSCCLYYRVPGGGLCGDCVLRTRRR